MFKRIDHALDRAENFMSGFEDDPEQEGVKETLEIIRDIQYNMGNKPPAIKDFFVFVDTSAREHEAFWSNTDGWGSHENATVFSADEEGIYAPPIIGNGKAAAERMDLYKVMSYLMGTHYRVTHENNSLHTGTQALSLQPGEEPTDYTLIAGRSVYIDVRNLMVQLSCQDDGLSIYVAGRGTGESIIETWAQWTEGSNTFFGDADRIEDLKKNLEAWTSDWQDYAQAHLHVDPGHADDLKKVILESGDSTTPVEELRRLVEQTLAALPDAALAGPYGIQAESIHALMALTTLDDPFKIRKGLVGADKLLLKAWDEKEAPMELIYQIRKVTFTL